MTICWVAVVAVWVGAARNHQRHAPSAPALGSSRRRALLGAALACAFVLALGMAAGLVLGVPWVEVLGLSVLVAATAFTVWARLALGAMWTVQARVGADHRLCTTGPYAVTRHPIYTGVLGMLLGTSVLVGDGQLILMVPIAVVLFETKYPRRGAPAAGDVSGRVRRLPSRRAAARPRPPRLAATRAEPGGPASHRAVAERG